MKNTFLIKMIISCSIGLAIFSTSYAKTILQDNIVTFFYKDTPQPNDPFNATFKITDFTVESYSVTPDQPWGGVSVSGTNELNVRAGRKGNVVNNEFLRSHDYNVKANGSGKNVNFAVIGNLSFSITSPHATSYKCSNIALQQAHTTPVVFSTNEWSFYSNQIDRSQQETGYRFKQPTGYNIPIIITCQNTQANTMNDFSVIQYTNNIFRISPVID